VLADPRLVESEFVHRDDQLEVSLEGERRILPSGMERRHEVSESHSHILDPASYELAAGAAIVFRKGLLGPELGDRVGHDNT